MSRTKAIIRKGGNAKGVSRRVRNARPDQDQSRKVRRMIEQSKLTAQQLFDLSRH
jgi:hypothetical protein